MKNKYVRFYINDKAGSIPFRKHYEGIVATADFIDDGEVFHILGLTVPMSQMELIADVSAKPNLVIEFPTKKTVKETEADRNINNFKALIETRLIKIHEAIREMRKARACFDPDTYLDRFNEIAEFSLAAYKVLVNNDEYSAAGEVSQRFVGSAMSICLDIYDAPTRSQLKRMLTRK